MQYLEPLLGALAALALVELIVFVGLLVVLVAVFVKRYLPTDSPVLHYSPTVTTGTSNPVEFKATLVPDAKALVKDRKELPGRSCGHCGARIKTDPVRAVVVGDISYHVYACPVCKKETMLGSKLA